MRLESPFFDLYHVLYSTFTNPFIKYLLSLGVVGPFLPIYEIIVSWSKAVSAIKSSGLATWF